MLIVSDTSPITNLYQVGHLDLLRALFARIVIPTAVFDELNTMPDQGAAIASMTWITVASPTSEASITELSNILDPGEAQAIVLTRELESELLIIDERKGRNVAQSFNIKTIGTLGVLVLAKEYGFISHIRPILDQMISQARFRIGAKLYDSVLKANGE